MRTAPLPLTQVDLPYLACVPRGDGTATLYEPGDEGLLPPVEVVPILAITARQLRLALLQAGLLAAVQSAVDATGGELAIWWGYSTEFHRDNPLVAAMAQAIGATPAQADAVWLLGATL